MPTITDQAVVIRHWDFSETSQTVSLFTREHGIVRGLAKGSRREKSRFSGGLELLTRGQIVAITKATTDLATFTEWDLQEVFWSCRRDLSAHRIGLYMIDLLHHVITDRDPHSEVFDGLIQGMRDLERPERRAIGLLRFQWTLLCEAGYRPLLERNARNGEPLAKQKTYGFSPADGGLVPDPGAAGASTTTDRGTWRVRAETVQLLLQMDQKAGFWEHASADGPTVDRGNQLLSHYFRAMLGRELPTRHDLFTRNSS